MPIKGIRLPDLYTSEDYTSWETQSQELIDKTIKQNPISDPNKVRGHLYMNSKIKELVGEEGFNNLSEVKTLDDKINWYNNKVQELEDSSNSEEAALTQPALVQKDTVKSIAPELEEPVSSGSIVPTNGTTIRDWFRDNAGGDYTAYIQAERQKIADRNAPEETTHPLSFLDSQKPGIYKSEKTQHLEDELSVLKDTNPNNLAGIRLLENQIKLAREEDANTEKEAFSDLYKEEELRQDITEGNEYYSPLTKAELGTVKETEKVNSLTDRLIQRYTLDPTYAFDSFKQFEDEMNKSVPQYRNYHDTPAFSYTPDEMQAIMAEYFAIRELKGPEAAANFAQATFQDRLAERQSIGEKARIATLQFGANIAGETAATVGILLNTLNGIILASDKDADIEDIGWWKEFLYYAADNGLTKWGNRVITTGVWNPDLQEKYEELQYNALQLQRAAGNEAKFIDINTPFEILAQSGFTVAGMLTGTTAAQILTNSVGKTTAALASKLLARESAGLGTRVASRGINAIGKNLVLAGSGYLPAVAEASLDAVDTYNISKNQSEEAILLGLEQQLNKEYNDGTYDLWYQRNSRIPFTLNAENSMSEEEVAQLTQLREQEKQYLWNVYKDLRVKGELSDPDVQEQIEVGAQRASAKNLYDETNWIALGDITISNTLGKAVKETKKAAKRAMFGEASNSKFKWVPEGSYYRPVANKPGFLDRVKDIGRGALEATEEGVEEMFQTVDSKMRQDLNKNLIAEYISNKYDPDGAAAITDNMWEKWDVASKSLGKNLLSKEAWFSFGLGAFSAGFGSPTVFRGIRTGANTYAKTGDFLGSVKEGALASFRNPFVESWRDTNIKYIESQQEAADLNKWISAHPEIETLNDETAILAFLNQQEKALREGDEATYRDALMGQQIATMLMFERVNPNGSKANFYAKLEELSKLSPADEQARDVLQQALVARGDTTTPRTMEGSLNEEETKVIEDVKRKASEVLNTYKNLKTQINILDSQFGGAISTEAKEALAYSLMMQNNWSERISTIKKAAIDSYNKANPDTPVAPISAETIEGKNALARYGSKENAEKEFNILSQRLNQLRASRKTKYKSEYRAELDKLIKAIKENRTATKALASLEEDTVITAQEILSLSDKDRAYLLDEYNRENYSEKQRKEISKFITSEGIRGETVNDLIDAGRLQNKKEYFAEEYETLTKNNGASIPIFDREVRRKAAETWTKKKLETAIEAETYEDFRDAMDKSFQTGDFTSMDKLLLPGIFSAEDVDKKTWEFYQKYKKEELARRAIRGIVEHSPEFANLTTDEKTIVTKTAEQVQREGQEITADSIIKQLADPEYINQLERQGVDVSSLRTSFEELAKTVEKVMKQKEVYDQNVKALQDKVQRKKAESEAEKNPTRTPEPKGKNPSTVINRDRYESSKTKSDRIFDKVIHNFTHRKQTPLTAEEYLDFVNFYIEEPIVGKILETEFDTTLTEAGIKNTIKKLEEVVENKLYLDVDAKDSEEVKNTLKLIGTLTGFLSINSAFREAGVDSSVQNYFTNAITEINPDFKKAIERSTPKINEKLSINGKSEKSLNTKAEKEWYTTNKIQENLNTLMKLPVSKVRYVLIKDSELERKLSEESSTEINDDTLPLIIAARVDKSTKGAIPGKDGYSYLYVGLLQDSRELPTIEGRNDLNSLRYLAMDQEEDGPIVNRNNKVYVFSGAVPKMPSTTTDKKETTSFRDWLFDKYKDIKDEGERKKAAIDDFISHYRRVKINIKDGEAVADYEYPFKDKTSQTARWDVEDPSVEASYTRGAYIRENEDGTLTPLFIEVRRVDEVDFDDAHTMYDALNDPTIDITDAQYVKNDGNYIRKSAVALTNLILKNRDLLLSSRTRGKAIAQLNGTSTKSGQIQSSVERYLNLLKSANVQKGDISIGIEIEDNTVKFISWETGTEEDRGGKSAAFDIPMVLSSMPLSALEGKDEKAIRSSIASFIQEGLKTLIYNEEGKIRTADTRGDGNQWPLIKFEDNYRKNDKEVIKVFERGDIELKLLGNIWQVRTYAIKKDPENVSLEKVADSTDDSKELENIDKIDISGYIDPSEKDSLTPAQKRAIARITASEFIDEHEGEHFELSHGETEVTTFIKGGEEDINWGDTSLAGQLATNFGTSVDKLYRIWRKTHSKEEVIKYMDDRGAGSWPGFSKTGGLPLMLEQFKRIDLFLKGRGEVQVSVDLIFRSTVEYDGKYKYLVGKPDIVTIDKDGKYHLYDMKSFRYQQGVSAKVPGFKSLFFTINGKRNIEKDMDKWRKQLSMYKVMIESKLGENTVAEDVGVIPIRLGYTVEGSIDPFIVPGIGAHKLVDDEGQPKYASFEPISKLIETTPNNTEESVTRCYDDVIKLQAITKLTDINPEGWQTMTEGDKVAYKLSSTKASAEEAKAHLPLQDSPKIEGDIKVSKPLNELTKEEALKEFTEKDLDDDITDQLVNAALCRTKKK